LYQMITLRSVEKYLRKFPLGQKGVCIETILNCNARCLMCYHAYKHLSGIMTMGLFKKIIDDCNANSIRSVGMSIYGEPLLDPMFFERVRYLRSYGMSYSFFTNAQLLDGEKAERLLQLGGLTRINFSVCGFDPMVYEKVMAGLKREVSYANILNFLRLKAASGRRDLTVSISTVKVDLIKPELKKFISFWKNQEGVDQIITSEIWNRMGGDPHTDKVGELNEREMDDCWFSPCRQLWGTVYIYYHGRVSPCCGDSDLRRIIVGDMNKETLEQIYSGDSLNALRCIHRNDRRRTHPICRKCIQNPVWY
jgi:pyruvate-formate lyase-activating enzyme